MSIKQVRLSNQAKEQLIRLVFSNGIFSAAGRCVCH